MTIEDPCTHPTEWTCKPSPDDPTRCVGQAKYEAWVVAEEEMAKARTNGTGLYFTPKPDVVGEVDMTADAHKLPLGHVGTAKPCCAAPGDAHEPHCVMYGHDEDA